MGSLSDRLRGLGAAVAEVSDRAVEVGDDARARARNAFVSGSGLGPSATASAGSRFFRRSPWIPALAAAACVALAGAGWRLASPIAPSARAPAAGGVPLSFSVGADAAPGVVGDWVAADADAPLQARFSDGSAIELSPGARVRVTTTNPAGADVLIERGAVHAAVAHPGGTGTARWAVRAGPFEVRVTGTTFDAAWDPTAETFALTMTEGRVVVTGPNIPPDRAVVGGERLEVSVRDARMVLSAGTAPLQLVPNPEDAREPPPTALEDARDHPSSHPGAAREHPATPHPPAAAVPAPLGSGTAVASAPPSALPTWKELAAKGRYRDAFAAAEAAGFGQEIAGATSGDLLILADAARFSGSPGRAREALLAARRRFGIRGQSAFLLGKIAADQQGSPGDAVEWFEVYLREEPGGALAEQALGRIVDLTRTSSPYTARRAAARYLARYPNGSYAELARSLSAP